MLRHVSNQEQMKTQGLNLRFKRSQVAFSAVPQSGIQTWDLVCQVSKISRRVSHSMGNFNDP